MWTCPKCGRTFKKQNQSHYCGKAPETVEGYILAQPDSVRVEGNATQSSGKKRNVIPACL